MWLVTFQLWIFRPGLFLRVEHPNLVRLFTTAGNLLVGPVSNQDERRLLSWIEPIINTWERRIVHLQMWSQMESESLWTEWSVLVWFCCFKIEANEQNKPPTCCKSPWATNSFKMGKGQFDEKNLTRPFLYWSGFSEEQLLKLFLKGSNMHWQ